MLRSFGSGTSGTNGRMMNRSRFKVTVLQSCWISGVYHIACPDDRLNLHLTHELGKLGPWNAYTMLGSITTLLLLFILGVLALQNFIDQEPSINAETAEVYCGPPAMKHTPNCL